MRTEPAWIRRMREVDWAALDYCYGRAKNVSELIETIVSGAEETAAEACRTLQDELVHQASLYSATYEAIPFLIEAAAAAAPTLRPRVLNVVAEILRSASYWIEMAERAGELNQDEWSIEFVRRIWLGSESFARFLHKDRDPLSRIIAAHLLGLLLTRGPAMAPAGQPDRYGAAVAALVERLQGKEPDEFALSSVIFAIGRGAVHDPSLIEHLRKAPTRPRVGEVTYVSVALAVMKIDDGRHADLEEVDLLIGAMWAAAESDGLFQLVGEKSRAMSPWIVGRLRFTLCEVLCAWSTGHHDRMERVLPGLLTGVRLASGYTAEMDLGPVFQWLWPDRKGRVANDGSFKWPSPITAVDMTGIARRVLQACYDNPRIWEPRTRNTALAFRRVGLPERRADLKVLLDEPSV